jgi:Tol biopolymer transport system component/predicted Ser/Thr protein kinase
MLGKTLGHYRVVEQVGAGGMGVVYKAQDLHLDRFVALKILPPEKVADPDRKRRFVQEAKAASALNHPNIITIYDIAQEGATDFIAMEYVDGQTLEQLIPRKGLRLGQTLKYAIPIADALTRAHGMGIVHRDLKPSNIMIDGHGVVRLLDFGLAKLTEAAPTGTDEPTRTVEALTDKSVIVGTVAYMSPEQAQGKTVDARSDIFSFGVVLYEMVTGQRAFKGDSAFSTLAAVVEGEVAPFDSDVPRDLVKIITRALRKDPERRFQHMADVRVALEELKEESDSGKLAVAPHFRAHKRRRLWLTAAGLVVAAAATGVALWTTYRSPAAIELKSERVTFDPGITTTPALSPDGKLIAYAADRSGNEDLDIYVQHMSGGQPNRLTHHEADDYGPTFSPDGSQIVFRSERDGGGLYTVDVLGGSPERKLVSGGRYPSFSPNGSTIVYVQDPVTGFPPVYKMYLVSSKGGPPKPFQPDFGVIPGAFGSSLSWSDDGTHVAFSGVAADKSPDWWIAPLDGGPPVATGAAGSLRLPRLPQFELASWHGEFLYFLRGSIVEGVHLFRAPLARGTWKLSGQAQRLTSGGGNYLSLTMASNGQMLFSNVNMTEDFTSIQIPPKGSEASSPLTRITSDATIKGGLSISRDGSTAAYIAFVSWESGRLELRVRNLAAGRETVYRSENLPGTACPEISPDGSLLAYAEQIGDTFISFVGPPESLPGKQVCEDCQVFGFSSDSQHALVLYGTRRLVRQSISTGAQVHVLTVSSGKVLDARLSPDDRWLVFVVAAPDRQIETYVTRVGDPSASQDAWLRIPMDRSYADIWWFVRPPTLRTTRNMSPLWNASADLLYYFSDRDGHACIWAQRLDARTKQPQGAPYVLRHLHRTATSAAVSGDYFLAGSQDRLFFPEWTATSNLWTAKLDPGK